MEKDLLDIYRTHGFDAAYAEHVARQALTTKEMRLYLTGSAAPLSIAEAPKGVIYASSGDNLKQFRDRTDRRLDKFLKKWARGGL